MVYTANKPSAPQQLVPSEPAPQGKTASIDLERFTQPKLFFTERIVAPLTTEFLVQDLYTTSQPILVDYICLTNETLTCNGAVPPADVAVGINDDYMFFLGGRWWITDRSYSTARETPSPAPAAAPVTLDDTTPLRYYNYAEARRWDYQDLLQGRGIPGAFTWRLTRPWLYKAGSGLTLDWWYATGALGAAAPATIGVDYVMYGIGVKTRQRRVFECNLAIINPALAGVDPTGSINASEFIANQTNEDFEIETISFQTPCTADFGGAVWLDARQWNMLRFRVRPAVGDPFSEDLVPMIMYGVDDAPFKAVWYQPTGGPIYLEPGQAIGWQVQNFGNVAAPGINRSTRVQVAYLGRVEQRG